MNILAPESTDASLWSSTKIADHKAILTQLDAIVSSVHFRSSKRYPSFLRFVVEEELSGRGSELKERTIGVEVFRRDVTYDTNEDPIVRVAAAEVRKRLAHYYADASHKNELRICLTSGSYNPTFQKFSVTAEPKSPQLGEPPHVTVADAELTAAQPEAAGNSILASQNNRRLGLWLTCAASLAILGGIVYTILRPTNLSDQALSAFWRPITDSHSTILASMGPVPTFDPSSSPSQPTPDMNLLEAVRRYNVVPLVDAIALSRLSAFLAPRKIQLRVMNSDTTSFDDVQNSPSILIGGFSNQWTIRLTSKLRFAFEDSPTISRILDHQAKVQPDWVLHRDKPYSSLIQDYAIVARFHDPSTGNMTVVVAGIGPNGTLAAGEFLTSGEDLAQLLSSVPRKDWQRVNVEAVIVTQVINGKSGPPQIVAASYW